MAEDNVLWNSPPREKQAHADRERLEREADVSLAEAVDNYDPKLIRKELEKYESNLSDLKSFAIFLS